MSALTPWAYGPFELIVHAEIHLLAGDDFDRRVALIGFDNAIEVAITTYLTLNPIQRGNRPYQKQQVEQWLHDYHSKIDFFLAEVQQRGLQVECDKASFVWYHDVRNGQYHAGGATIPQQRELDGIRKAALWVFSVLFDVQDAEKELEHHIAEIEGDKPPPREDRLDRLIDDAFGLIELANNKYYASEMLHAVDPAGYVETGRELEQQEQERAQDEAPEQAPPAQETT